MDEVVIRVVTRKDAQELLNLYRPYVEHTAISFEYEAPTVEEFAQRIEKIQSRYPYYAAVYQGQIVGYVYAGAFHTRAAFAHCVETSIYVRKDCKGMGIGRRLYEELEKALKAQNILNLYACIAYPEQEDEYLNKNSVHFHEHMGYQRIGEFRNCGYKFGHWYGIVWMEKFLGEHGETVKPVVDFRECCDDFS